MTQALFQIETGMSEFVVLCVEEIDLVADSGQDYARWALSFRHSDRGFRFRGQTRLVQGRLLQ